MIHPFQRISSATESRKQSSRQRHSSWSHSSSVAVPKQSKFPSARWMARMSSAFSIRVERIPSVCAISRISFMFGMMHLLYPAGYRSRLRKIVYSIHLPPGRNESRSFGRPADPAIDPAPFPGGSGADFPGEEPTPEGEELREPASDHRTDEHPTDRAERNGVVDEVLHFDAPFHLPEVVLVVPEPVRSEPLLVDEQRRLPHVGDLRDPPHRDPRDRADAVRDDHAGVHLPRRVRRHLETERGRRDPRQVPRVREEPPRLLEGDREALHFPHHGRPHPAPPRSRESDNPFTAPTSRSGPGRTHGPAPGRRGVRRDRPRSSACAPGTIGGSFP